MLVALVVGSGGGDDSGGLVVVLSAVAQGLDVNVNTGFETDSGEQ